MSNVYKRVQNSFANQNFLTLLDAKLESVETGKVVISCKHRDELTQQQGFLHGGVVTTLADVACGYTALTVMPEGYEVLTAEFKINLIRPAVGEIVIATGCIVKAGKSLVITEAEVRDGHSDKLIAKMLATMVPVLPEVH